MNECLACLGEGEYDFSAEDVALERIARVFCMTYEPLGVQPCTFCGGTGQLTDEELRHMQAYAVARVDQFFAAVDAGEISVP